MHILRGDRWTGGYLDYHRGPGEYRVAVYTWKGLGPVEHALRGRTRHAGENARLVLRYLRHLGPGATVATIRARRREPARRRREVACGLGRILEGPTDGLPAGTPVAFLATNHPQCVERLVLPPSLVAEVDGRLLEDVPPGCLLYLPPAPDDPELAGAVRPVSGWSRHAGLPAPAFPRALVDAAVATASPDARAHASILGVAEAEPVREVRQASTRRGARRPGAVVFGYGQHARTLVLPAVRRHLEVSRIHEIDPTPVPHHDAETTWSTSPLMPPAGEIEGTVAAFIAGYHHTHAPLAAAALDAGLYAVVEKPVATREEDLDRLIDSLRRHGPRLFVGYHKRYHPFNGLARRDLGVEAGDPITYHCIVYELPLPRHHWYRWPNSRSRIVSNGCHWIDHFLFLNDYARPVHSHVDAADGAINCSVVLENGAYFTMALTDRGSGRLGVQNHVELRAGSRTVRMVNDTAYAAEDERRVVRRASCSKLSVYFGMYDAIARRIVRGEAGDSLRSVEVSARLVLALDRQLVEARTGGNVPGAAVPANAAEAAVPGREHLALASSRSLV
jgi:predicted dehydrogenase